MWGPYPGRSGVFAWTFGQALFPGAAHGQQAPMTFGTSLFLLAVGAILRFAVSDSIEGVDLSIVGLILMIVGALGLLLALFLLNRERDVVVTRDRDVPPTRY
jgi:hypothetical protein